MKNKLLMGVTALAVAGYAAVATAPAFADNPPGVILAQDRTAPGTPGTTRPPSAVDPKANQAEQERMARLAAAQPLTQANVSADAVIGTEVRNPQDQKLGSVKDLVMTEGKVVGIVLARGGLLGMGTSYHQIDSAHAKITADVKTIVLDLADDQAKALPKVEYKEGKWAQVIDEKETTPPATAPSAPPSRTTPPASSPPAATLPKTPEKADPPKTDAPKSE